MSVAEREGLTPAEAAAAAHGIGDKVKPTLSEAGASEAREMATASSVRTDELALLVPTISDSMLSPFAA
jgi:hypothetical protein